MRTLYDTLQRTVPPWRSLDAVSGSFPSLPQQDIDICLCCEHCAEACDRCDGRGNLTAPTGRSPGRPRKEIDTATLRRMLRLRRCNREICAALGVSERTLRNLKNQYKEELE